MLHLSRNSQIRHQKRAAQLGDQFLKRIRLRAKLIAFFTIEAGRCPRPVNQLMQAGGVEVRRVREAEPLRQDDFIGGRTIERLYALLGDFCPCLLYTSPSARDGLLSRMPSSA